MSCHINPDLYCEHPDGCKRPKATGRSYCTQHIRLARAVGQHLDDEPLAGPSYPYSVSDEMLESWPVLPADWEADFRADLLDDSRASEAAELEDGES